MRHRNLEEDWNKESGIPKVLSEEIFFRNKLKKSVYLLCNISSKKQKGMLNNILKDEEEPSSRKNVVLPKDAADSTNRSFAQRRGFSENANKRDI